MIICFCSDEKTYLGCGKTLSATAFAFSDYEDGATIFANYKLEFPFKPLNIELFLDQIVDIKKATVVIDEMQVFADSSARTKVSRFLTYFALQSSKRDINLYYTTQRFLNVDLRIRKLCDMVFECQKYHYNKEKCAYEHCYGDMECSLDHTIRLTEKLSGNRSVLDVNTYKDLYDRRELIQPIDGDLF